MMEYCPDGVLDGICSVCLSVKGSLTDACNKAQLFRTKYRPRNLLNAWNVFFLEGRNRPSLRHAHIATGPFFLGHQFQISHPVGSLLAVNYNFVYMIGGGRMGEMNEPHCRVEWRLSLLGG
jgi:hypothetical protein